MSLPRTLFVGRGSAAICWYRCALPATALGQDWVGLEGEGRLAKIRTGVTARPFAYDDLFDYEVVVIQMAEAGWTPTIRELQAGGATVLVEIDDYFQAVRKLRDHEGSDHWSRKRVEGLERVMRLADGVICSTDFLARRYRALNPVVRVCRNGIDLRRYAYERPARDGVTVGWAGGVGHREALGAWLPEIAGVMRRRPEVSFTTVGQPYGKALQAEFGTERVTAIPWGALESYPASMTAFDIALAPAGRSNLYRGKSDLRWLEAGALGIPCIADPSVYPDIEPGVTGLHAATPREAGAALERLVGNAELRAVIGAAAHAHVRDHRSAEVAARQWDAVLRELAPRCAEPVVAASRGDDA